MAYEGTRYCQTTADLLCRGRPEVLRLGIAVSLVTFFAAAKKVTAAPHRGNANRPTRTQDPATHKKTKRTGTRAKRCPDAGPQDRLPPGAQPKLTDKPRTRRS